jgi:hypothetical protein
VSNFGTKILAMAHEVASLQVNLPFRVFVPKCYDVLMTETTVQDFLVFGDAVRDRAEHDSQPVAKIAADLGASPAVAAKAAWLARAYPHAARAELGRTVLADLSPSHLEAVALLPGRARTQLLLRAARERLGVRTLKKIVSDHPIGARRETIAVSGGEDLARSMRAISSYLEFNDDQLRRLLAGPRGSTIKALARAGAALSTRIGDNSLRTPQSNRGTVCP